MSSEDSSKSSAELQLKVADLEAEMSRLQRRLVSVQQKVKVEHRHEHRQDQHASSKRSNKNTREDPPRHPEVRTTRTKNTPNTTKVRKTDPVSSRSAAPPVKKRTSPKKQGKSQPKGLRVVRRPNKSRQASVGPQVLSQLQSTRQLKLNRTTTTKNRLSLLSAIRQRFFWKTMNINLTRVQAIEQAPSTVRPKSSAIRPKAKPKTLAPAPTKRRPDVIVVPPTTRTIQPTGAPPPPERRPQMLKRLQGNLQLDIPKSPRTATLQNQQRHKQRPRPPARHDTPALACLAAAQSNSNSNSNCRPYTAGRDPPPQIVQVARQPISPVVVVVGSCEPPPASSVEPVHNKSNKTKGIWRRPKQPVLPPKETPTVTTTTWKKSKATPSTTTSPFPRLQTSALLADIRKTPKLASATSTTTAKVGTAHKINAHLSATTKKGEQPMADILHAAPKLKPTKTKVGNVVTSPPSSSLHHKTTGSMLVGSAKKEEPPSLGGAPPSHASDGMVSSLMAVDSTRNASKLNSVRTKVVGSATSSSVDNSKTTETRGAPPGGGPRSNNNVSIMVSTLKNGGNIYSSPRRDPPPQRKPDPPAKVRSRIHVQSFVQDTDKPAADCSTETTTVTNQPRGYANGSQQQHQSTIVKKWNRFASMETKGICAAPRLQTKVVAHQTKHADHKTMYGRPALPKAKPGDPRIEIPARSNLLAQIRQKDIQQLKSVDHDVDTPNSTPPALDLFAGIRAGVALNKVEEADKGPAQEKVSHGSALLAKLQARKAQIYNQQQDQQVKPAVPVPVVKSAKPRPCHTNGTAPPAVDMFAGIRAGVALKKVQETEKAVNKAPHTRDKVTHSSALLAKLQARKKECMKRSGSGTPIEDDW